jgi:hypothetical protein
VLYGLLMLIHAILPPMFSTSGCLVVHKKDPRSEQ